MPQDFDPFKPSTGLPDDFDMIVKESWFEFDPDINDGQTLVLKMAVETSDEDFGEGGVGELMFSCGKGWETSDRGATAVREDGSVTKGFHQSTAYHLFIGEALKCDSAEKVLRSSERGDPRKAAMWVGTGWHLNSKVIHYGGEIGDKNKLVPTKFLGVGTNLASLGSGGGPVKATGVVKKAAPPKAAPTKAAGPVKKAAPKATEGNGAGSDVVDPNGNLIVGTLMWTSLYEIAMESDDHASFVERAFNEVHGVAGDELVEQAVMSDGDGSVWAKAVADYEATTNA